MFSGMEKVAQWQAVKKEGLDSNSNTILTALCLRAIYLLVKTASMLAETALKVMTSVAEIPTLGRI
jgi:hypothetical protein